MKPIGQILILTLATFTALASAQEASPREQFQNAVTAFQKSATEDNARKLAELCKQLGSPPAISEDAEFHALKGTAFVKQAKVAADPAAFAAVCAKAAAEFQAASTAAPWVGAYYYNRADCEKSAGQFAAATAALKLDLIFARTEQDRDANLALRAEIETAQEIAATRKQAAEKLKSDLAAKEAAAAAAKQQAAEERKKNSIEGYWFYIKDGQAEAVPQLWIERVGETLVLHGVNGEQFYDVQITETSVRMKWSPAPVAAPSIVVHYVLDLRDGYLVGENRASGKPLSLRYIRKPWPAK